MPAREQVAPHTDAGMKPAAFDRFCAIARERAGLDLRPGKEMLVAARVARRQRALGIPSVDDYLEYLESEQNGGELYAFIDAVTTNYTSFFRESEHFEILHRFLTDCSAEGQRRFRLWSSAAASGEEPYSMAMTALEALGTTEVDVKILATEISTNALERAKIGRYDHQAARLLKENGRMRFVARVRLDGGGTALEIRPEVRALVVLRHLNLSQLPLAIHGPLDVVFCRNVLIYFGAELRDALLRNIVKLLRPGGMLITGHSESLVASSLGLAAIKPSIYRKPDSSRTGHGCNYGR